MKKFGFTLAEILITMGIVGVVAAITLPTLMSDTASAQIGPKLAKAVSMFEQANLTMLNENSLDAISNMEIFTEDDSVVKYGEELSNYLKISQYEYDNTEGNRDNTTKTSCSPDKSSLTYDTPTFVAKDGVMYMISAFEKAKSSLPPHKTHIGYVWIDLNGESLPNTAGTDLFLFALYNDGSLKPAGTRNWNGKDSILACYWKTTCPNDAVATDYYACSASVFENNLKVLYK